MQVPGTGKEGEYTMKILLKASCSEEFYEGPHDYAVAELSEDDVRQLLELMGVAGQLKEKHSIMGVEL